MVRSEDDLGPDDDVHPDATAKGFVEILDLAAVQDVVENLKTQGADSGTEQRHKAFLHYLKHDSFLELG
jgi:hypothetical protein